MDVQSQDGVTVLRINATLGEGFGDYTQWKREVDQAFDPAPSALLLDQRRGDGGSFQGLHYLTRHLLAPGDTPTSVVLPWLFAREEDRALRSRMVACARTNPGLGCGGAQWIPAELAAPDVPFPGRGSSARLAVMIGLDVSGNDWLTDHLRRRRRSGQVRVFGPAPTFGAFGEVVGLPTHRVGYVGPRIQWTGGLVAFGDMDPLNEFLDGNGVVPDQVVLQLQSDALRGVDTQRKEALSWLNGDR